MDEVVETVVFVMETMRLLTDGATSSRKWYHGEMMDEVVDRGNEQCAITNRRGTSRVFVPVEGRAPPCREPPARAVLAGGNQSWAKHRFS
jgi:hypothetical protein